MKTQLLIYDFEVELDESVLFLLNTEFEKLSNPTLIINEWSKTVSIPFTEANNRLFGYIYKPERIIADDGTPDSYKQMNVYFDPYIKLDFKLIYNANVVMEGYAKMNSIKRSGDSGTYEMTLYGQLGKVFLEMKKITFDYATENQDYLIDCSTYFYDYLTKENVKDSFESAGQTSPLLIGSYINYMGFAPNNSMDSEFDYKTYQKDENSSDTFVKELENVNFYESAGVEANSAIPDGLLPREIGEYRSYLQQPYVYFNKLFKIFQAKAESITGYTFYLDSDWFNTSNPYWFKLVYMLKKIDVANGNSYFNQYKDIVTDTSINSIIARWNEPTSDDYTDPISGNFYINTIVDEQKPVLSNNKLYIYTPMALNLRLRTRLVVAADATINTNNGLLVTVNVVGQNNYTESQKFLIVNENYSGSYSGATIIRTGAATGINLPIPYLDCYFLLEDNKFGDYVTINYSVNWLVNSYPYNPSSTQITTFYYIDSNISTAAVKINGEYWARSGAAFTLNTFWNKEYNIFNEILNYCKVFRIGIFADEFTKTIKFIPLSKYFEDYTIEDWTDKVDYSKEYIVKPISFENKYVLFNYDDNKTKLGKQYKEKFGVNYGEKRLVTSYNFNDKTTNLFSGMKDPLISTDNVLSWVSLYQTKQMIYTFPAEKYVHCKDDSQKYVDCFGLYYFHNGTVDFDDSSILRPLKVSDDTPFQQYNDKYFYSQTTNFVNLTSYPDLSLACGDNLCVFNRPQENYTYDSSLFDGKKSIYENYWENYINERYNVNNKIVTCYLKLTPIDYINFEFRHFIKIDGVLYMINKIYDYNIETPESTKVDLITINDISGYTE